MKRDFIYLFVCSSVFCYSLALFCSYVENFWQMYMYMYMYGNPQENGADMNDSMIMEAWWLCYAVRSILLEWTVLPAVSMPECDSGHVHSSCFVSIVYV